MIEFKFRHYDYAIGRFVTTDPLADSYRYNSPYAFQENKLGLGVELEGLELGPSKYNPTGLALGLVNQNTKNAKKHLENGDSPAMAYAKGAGETGLQIGGVAVAVASLFVPDPSDIVIGGAVLKFFGFFKKGKKVVSKIDDVVDTATDVSKTTDKATDVKKMDDVIDNAKDVSTKADRIKTDSKLEKAQNQLEGIEKAQDAKKKAVKGQKQSAIQSVKKSKQNFKKAIKEIDLDDLD